MERNSKFDEMFEFDLNGVEIRWPHLFKPDTKYAPVWSVDIVLPDKLAADMAKVGFNIKKAVLEDGRTIQFIKAKRKTHKKDGTALYPPKVFDAGSAGQRPQYWDENKLIGNGSIANIKVAAQYREVSGRTLLPLYLNSIQIVKLVEYSSGPFDSVNEDNTPF